MNEQQLIIEKFLFDEADLSISCAICDAGCFGGPGDGGGDGGK